MVDFTLNGKPIKPIDLGKAHITVPTSVPQPGPKPSPLGGLLSSIAEGLGGIEDVSRSLGSKK